MNKPITIADDGGAMGIEVPADSKSDAAAIVREKARPSDRTMTWIDWCAAALGEADANRNVDERSYYDIIKPFFDAAVQEANTRADALAEGLKHVSEKAASYCGCQCGEAVCEPGDCWPCRMMDISADCEDILEAHQSAAPKVSPVSE